MRTWFKDFGSIVCQVLNLLRGFFVLKGVLYLGIKLHEFISLICFNETNAILALVSTKGCIC